LNNSFFSFKIWDPFLKVVHWNCVNLLSILTKNPNCCLFSCRLSCIFKQWNKIFEHSLKVIFRRVLPKYILNSDKKLINNSFSMLSCASDLFNLFRNDSHTFLNTFFVSDGNFSNSFDTFFNKFRVNFTHVLFEFFENWFVIFIIDDSGENFYFFVLDVIRICEFREETFNIVLENWWSLFDDVLNIF